MLIKLPSAWIMVLNVGGWLFLQLGLAWVFLQLPLAWFNQRPPRVWEPRVYEALLKIRDWKDRLPDAAAWFRSGFRKSRLQARGTEYLTRFVGETWRAELCHWWALACAPVFWLWNPWWGELIIVGYALAANLPCILAQRYNRTRLLALLSRRALRPAR